MSLMQYFQTNVGLPINKWAHYIPIYEKHFANFRNRSLSFLEIGSGQGGSSRMWKHYFGPTAQIVTVDIRPDCKIFEDEQVCVRIGNQSDSKFLQALVEEFGPFDIVVDDGSHQMSDVCASFNYIFPKMAREGVYLIEDTHTAYWDAYGGGLRRSGTIIEMMKNFIDELHYGNPHHAINGGEQMPTSDISQKIRSISFYDGVIAIEKGPFVNKKCESIPFVEGQTIW